MANSGRNLIIALLVVSCSFIGGVSTTQAANGQNAATNSPNADLKILLNFQDVTLKTVLEYLSEKAGLVIVSDDNLDHRLSVISRQPLTVDEAISLINSILKESSYAAVRMGRTLRIVPLTQAKTMNIPVTSGSDPGAVTPSDDIVTHVIPIRYADAAKLKENLASLIPEYASLEANEDGNALIVTDTTANIRRLMQIVQALDTHMATIAEIRVFRLTSADATSTANLINNIFKQEQQGGTRGQQTPRGPFEMMMDRGAGGRRGSRRDGDEQEQTRANVQVVAAADKQTNSVVVRGPAEALDIVANVIKALDDRTASVADVRVFHLKYADAQNTAQLINEVFAQDGTSRAESGGARMFRGPFGPAQQTQEDTGGRVQVVAAADDRTNTVVVTGPANVLDVVADVVKALDSQSPQVADVKVFHLEYADAENAAELINEVFGEERTSRTQARSQQTTQIRFGRGGFQPGAQQTQETSSLDVVVVAAADERTNSVVVSGPPETLEVIAQIVKQLDENPEQERQIFVYPLKNAQASNLKDILNNLFTEMQTLREQRTGTSGQRFQGAAQGPAASTGGQSSGEADLSEEAYFEADEDTNTLLVMTSSKNYTKIKNILDELDKPVPQVLIKVLLAEVTHTGSVDLGTEFSILNMRSDGDSTLFSTDFGIAAETGGFIFKTIEGDVDVALRALEQVGKLDILSRPYILTSNNQAAKITVGEEVPFIRDTRMTETGQTINTIEYEDIGIILEVTPHINPDGLVIMDVKPEISATTGQTIPISETVDAAVFAKRSSESRVAILDGQTIVIGGLMEDQSTENVEKVPLLGDIPLLGFLFQRSQTEKQKTELLIFLTPHVAAKDQELAAISDRERLQSKLVQKTLHPEVLAEHIKGTEGRNLSESGKLKMKNAKP
jgi:general secretion pathway protein D